MRALALLLLFSGAAHAAEIPIFTTIFYDSEGVVYAGLQRKNDAKVVAFEFPDGARTHIDLPDDIAGRDVIGVLPDREKLFILTQGDDSPRVDLYNQKKKTWKKIGAVKCAAFTKVKIAATSLTFSCEAGMTKKGKVKVLPKVIHLGRDRLYRSGIMRFPEFLLRYKGVSLILEGQAPTWEKLRLKTDGAKDRVYQAKEFFSP